MKSTIIELKKYTEWFSRRPEAEERISELKGQDSGYPIRTAKGRTENCP